MTVENDTVGEETGPEELFRVIHTVLQTNVQFNYSDCSARWITLEINQLIFLNSIKNNVSWCRETRQCLVTRYANRVLDVVNKFGVSQRNQLGLYSLFRTVSS